VNRRFEKAVMPRYFYIIWGSANGYGAPPTASWATGNGGLLAVVRHAGL